MRMPTLSEIGKGPLFQNLDIMGMGESSVYDEHWMRNKEEEMVTKNRSSNENMVMKDVNLKAKTLAARDKLLAGEMDAKTRLFGNQSFNQAFNFDNKKMFRGGNMYNNNYSKKVEDIMGKSKKASKSNYQNKVAMVMGNHKSKGGGFNMKAFDMKAKSFLGMGGGMKKSPMPKINMLGSKGSGNFNMSQYFGKAQKPTQKVNIQNLISGAKGKGANVQSLISGVKGNGGVNVQSLIYGAKAKEMPNQRAGLSMQDKINGMLGNKSMMGAKNIEASAIMGMSQKPEGMAWNRVNIQKKLDLWGDADGDKVANILDCQPTNAKFQGFWGNVKSVFTGKKEDEGASRQQEEAAMAKTLYPESNEPYREFVSEQESRDKPAADTFREVNQEKLAEERAAEKLKNVESEEEIAESYRRQRRLLQAKYGDELTKPELLKLEKEAEQLAREEQSKTKEAQLKQLKIDAKKKKTMQKIEAKSPEARAKLLKAQAELEKAKRITSSTSGKGKKKTTTKYGSGYTPVGRIGTAMGGAASMFGSQGGFQQMAGASREPTGLGLQMASTSVAPGLGFQMASLGGNGMGFQKMANIKSGSGNGFYQMLGVQAPMQEQMEQPQMEQPQMEQPQMEQPQMEQSQMETPAQNTSAGTMMIDGVKYIRLSSGKWKNTKTGQEVQYPRGKYKDN